MALKKQKWIFITLILIALIILVILIYCLVLKKEPPPEFSLITGDSYNPQSELIIKAANNATNQNRPLHFQFDNYLFSDASKAAERNGIYYWQIDFNYLEFPESALKKGEHIVRFGFESKNMSLPFNIKLYFPAIEQEADTTAQSGIIVEKPSKVSQPEEGELSAGQFSEPYNAEIQIDNTKELHEIHKLFANEDRSSAKSKLPYTVVSDPADHRGTDDVPDEVPDAVHSPSETDMTNIKLTNDEIQDNIEEVKDLKEVLETDVIFDRAWKKDPNKFEDKFKATDRPDTTDAVEDLSPELHMQAERDKYILAANKNIEKYQEQQVRNQSYTSVSEVNELIKQKGYFDLERNYNGKGFPNDFSVKMQNGRKVIFDRKTGLTWQQSGSGVPMTFNDALDWIDNLNKSRFAGYQNWRLPSLEETMTLMEPETNQYGLNIFDEFDRQQMWFWTSSKENAKAAWVVNFDMSSCYYSTFDSKTYVRAVR